VGVPDSSKVPGQKPISQRMTKIPSEWSEKKASTKISWSDDVGLLESAGEMCILECADVLATGVCDQP